MKMGQAWGANQSPAGCWQRTAHCESISGGLLATYCPFLWWCGCVVVNVNLGMQKETQTTFQADEKNPDPHHCCPMQFPTAFRRVRRCLLYTSDAADE